MEMHITSPSSFGAQSDLELALLAKENDAGAFAALSERYLPFLRSRAGRCSSLAGVEVEDCIQEGLLALYRAVKGYDHRMGTRFNTFAFTCIQNSITSAVRRHRKNLPKGLPVNIDNVEEQNLLWQASYRSGQSPVEDIYMEMEANDRRMRQIETLLSGFERHVLKLYLSGRSYQHIAEVLSTTTKAVDNALQRVRRKLRPEP